MARVSQWNIQPHTADERGHVKIRSRRVPVLRRRLVETKMLLFSALCFVIVAPQVWAQPDWDAVEREATELLQQSIQVNTVNPPGNETAAARFWTERFTQEGIEARVYESQSGRGIVYARLKGSGHKKALILLNHLDVVPAHTADWEVDPFAGEVRDGYIYGRGAIDCKGVAVIQFLALALLKRADIALNRDVIFLGTGDEEVGGSLGAGWFVEHHTDLFADAEFLLTEGGGIRVQDDRRTYDVAIAEKAPCWIQLEASGPAGHGSQPASETAVTRLIRALDKLRRYKTEIKVVPPVQTYFAALAVREDPVTAARYRDLQGALADPTFLESFTADPRHNALVRNTIAFTVLGGSQKTNVIPAHASAQLDCRLLPGEDSAAFLAELQEIVNDPHIQFTPLLQSSSLASHADTALFRAIQRVAEQHDPDAVVVPSMITGFTDARYFRRRGIISYGFSGLTLTEEDAHRVHGPNERLSVASLRGGTQMLFDLLQALN